MKSNKLTQIVLILITLVILLVSIYLSYLYSKDESVTCPFDPGGSECETVRQSEYSSLFGVKVPVLGSFYFAFVLLVQVLNYVKFKSPKFPLLMLVLALWAFMFEGYLTYVQAVILETFCRWCIITEVLINILFLISLYYIFINIKYIFPKKS